MLCRFYWLLASILIVSTTHAVAQGSASAIAKPAVTRVSLPGTIDGLPAADAKLILDLMRAEFPKHGLTVGSGGVASPGVGIMTGTGTVKETKLSSGPWMRYVVEWRLATTRREEPFSLRYVTSHPVGATPDVVRQRHGEAAAKLVSYLASLMDAQPPKPAAATAGAPAAGAAAKGITPATATAVVPTGAGKCISRSIPNPRPLPAETYEWYGNCEGALSGVTIWKQHGEFNTMNCTIGGEGQNLWQAIKKPHELCLPYFAALPGFCKVEGKYYGQCQGGQPHGYGYQIHDKNAFTTISMYNLVPDFHRYQGNFKNGRYEGFGILVQQECSIAGCSKVKVQKGLFANGKHVLACENPGDCRTKRAAEVAALERKKEEERRRPTVEKRAAAIAAGRCDDAKALDAELGETAGHAQCLANVERNAKIARRSTALDELRCDDVRSLDTEIGDGGRHQDCLLDAALKAPDARTMFLAAVKYEADKRRAQAKQVYLKLIDRFPKDDLAIKASERLTALGDVEAIEQSNAAAADKAARQQQQTRDSIERAAADTQFRQQQEKTKFCDGRHACYDACDKMRGAPKDSCTSQCRSRYSACF